LLLWALLTTAALFADFGGAPAARGQSIPGETTPHSLAIRISEFMADNESTLRDGDGDYPDWIELVNTGETAVNLAGWTVTDKPHELDRWTFPSVTIPARGYLVLYASGNDRRDPAGELHTNFRLSADGEFLALLNPDGVITSAYSPGYPAQFPDISYGRDAAGNERYFNIPTPGSDNDIAENLGPLLSDITHGPEVLHNGEALVVEARVAASQHEVTGVELLYRIGFGPERQMAMTVAGAGEDGSLVYTATIPASAYGPGQIVRYAVRATDAGSYAARWPIFASPSASSEYQGTMVVDPAVNSSLPVLYWFMQDVNAANTDEGARAVVVYDNVLYDNVLVRLRGDTTTSRPKKSYKIIFNDGYHLRLTSAGHLVDEINVNSNVDDFSYLHQVLAWEAYRDAGAPHSLALAARVQRNGEFFGLYTLVEQPEKPYFERQDLDWSGALYKVDGNNLSGNTSKIDKKTRTDEDFSDLKQLMEGIHRSGPARTAYLFDNINVPATINYLAVSTVIHHWDIVIKNHYLYRDTLGTGEWMFLPWDMDLTFGAPAPDSRNAHPLHGTEAHPLVYEETGAEHWNHLIDALLTNAAIQEMYLRRLRSVMDQLMQPMDTPYEERYFETRIDELAGQLEQDARLDYARWAPPVSFEAAIDDLRRNGIAAQRGHLYVAHGPASATGLIPEEQPPHPRIRFGEVDLASAVVYLDSEYFVLTNPNDHAVDISGWQIAGDVDYTFQPGVVIPAGGYLYVAKDVNAFRNRTVAPTGGMGLFIQGGYAGNLTGRIGDLRLSDRTGTLIDRVSFGYDPITDIYLPVIRTE
jgi:hypothetical protein